MTIEHITRRRQTYYLHAGTTKTGKPKYFFSLKSEGIPVNAIPEGYEIYENPNAQVFLRKIPAQIITPEEIAIVQTGIEKYAKTNLFILDVKSQYIVVYLCDQVGGSAMDLDSFGFLFAGKDSALAKAALARSRTYSPMMQFGLHDPNTREFVVERWCFRGAIDDWIPLDGPAKLADLVKTYGRHLGKESFYDLTPYG
jgi:hypothetical protein